LIARVATALARNDSLEEIGLELASSVLQLDGEHCSALPGEIARVARVLRELEHDYSTPHQLTDLAALAGLSRYHFLRTFKRVAGITPHQWLIRTRLREAARRCAENDAPITEIAYDVGFDDLSNFIRSFRAEFGCSPRAYRASARRR
jgi:AraC family transcriptional regulator